MDSESKTEPSTNHTSNPSHQKPHHLGKDTEDVCSGVSGTTSFHLRGSFRIPGEKASLLCPKVGGSGGVVGWSSGVVGG